jgi:type II secretory pathway pseudopilin PulG
LFLLILLAQLLSLVLLTIQKRRRRSVDEAEATADERAMQSAERQQKRRHKRDFRVTLGIQMGNPALAPTIKAENGAIKFNSLDFNFDGTLPWVPQTMVRQTSPVSLIVSEYYLLLIFVYTQLTTVNRMREREQ